MISSVCGERHSINTDWFVIAAVALLFVGPFFLFPAGWFGDDCSVLSFVQRNVHSNISDIFLYKDSGLERYRPLLQTLATVSYRHFGLNAILIRVAAYAACLTTLVLLYVLLRQFKTIGPAPLIGVLSFAVLPIQARAIARPGRAEIFVTTFCLLAVFC